MKISIYIVMFLISSQILNAQSNWDDDDDWGKDVDNLFNESSKKIDEAFNGKPSSNTKLTDISNEKPDNPPKIAKVDKFKECKDNGGEVIFLGQAGKPNRLEGKKYKTCLMYKCSSKGSGPKLKRYCADHIELLALETIRAAIENLYFYPVKKGDCIINETETACQSVDTGILYDLTDGKAITSGREISSKEAPTPSLGSSDGNNSSEAKELD